MENLTITLSLTDIMQRCRMLAAYEGRDRSDGAGQNMYEKLAITPQDEPLVGVFLSQALLAVRQRLDDMILSVTATAGSTPEEQWTIRSIQRRYDTKGYDGLVTHLKEALSASVLAAWLTFNAVDQRAAFYVSVFESEMKLISDNIHTKAAPKRPT